MCLYLHNRRKERRVLNYTYFNYIQRSSVFVCTHINSLPVLITVIYIPCRAPTGGQVDKKKRKTIAKYKEEENLIIRNHELLIIF